MGAPPCGRGVVELIVAKRDGGQLEDAEIRWLIARYAQGQLPEEQMAAMAMAIFFRGLTTEELSVWTDAMLHSGEVLDLSALGRGRVDKHSTGGVGDKTSLILAPAVAAAGVIVPMVSGRGLGHTGGTIDKLEAIAGFSADVSVDRFREILADVGCAIIGQTENIAPADKRMYALRDVTATVASLPLIVSSIMSKKLAEGIEGLVLDIKVGRAAFMKTLEDARALAQSMVDLGERMGVRVIAFLTRMDEPLGRMVGNACEVREALALLDGGGPPDMVELVTTLGGAMVEIAHGLDAAAAKDRVRAALDDGSARDRFDRMIAALGGDLSAIVPSPGQTSVTAERGGFVTAIDGLQVGKICARLGAGRSKQGDALDFAVGIRVDRPRGAAVAAGDALCTVLWGDNGPPSAEAIAELRASFTVGAAPPPPAALILERLDASGTESFL